MRRLSLVSVLVLAACGSGTTTGGAPIRSVLHARGLPLAPGEVIRLEVAAGVRGLELRPGFEPRDARLTACPLAGIEAELPPIEDCVRDINQGVRTPLEGSRHAFLLESETPIVLDLVAEYGGGGRVEIRYPRTPPSPSVSACADHACAPFFERLPVRGGRLGVEASFVGDGGLIVEQGRILARSQTATGLPYRLVDARDGSPAVLDVSVSADAEYAVSLRQEPGPTARGLTDVRLVMTWPD